MMREADGYVGEVYIRNEGGVQVMNEANHVLFTRGFGLAPVFREPVNDSDIVRMFESALVHLRASDDAREHVHFRAQAVAKMNMLPGIV